MSIRARLGRLFEQRCADDARPDRLLVHRDVAELGGDVGTIVAGGEHERHATLLEGVHDGVDRVALEVDVEHRAVDRLRGLDQVERVVGVGDRTDDRRAEGFERLLHLLGDEVLVLDEENPFARQRCRRVAHARLLRGLVSGRSIMQARPSGPSS
ncbi:hypothetical protein [Aureimonas leprariae]|uniref:hypothetical protein n=1 Tax=Plantimonas leprariae TaxID=2615207 RepID=UPI003CCD80CF